MNKVQAFCKQHGIEFNKNLGQHFLVSESALRKIVETASIEPNDHVLEIGPGIGVLTKELLERAGRVTAIDLDRRFIELVEEYTGNPDQLTLIQGDALKTEFPNEEYKIVANIPYQITAPLLKKTFLDSTNHPTSLTLLIQKEVAQKICDKDEMSRLGILVQLFGTPKLVQSVPPGAFLPPPKVTSAILDIQCHPEPLTDAETLETIFQLTHTAFTGKRKMLRATIGKLEGGMERLEKAGIDATRRPQTVSVKEWILLAKSYEN